MLGNMKKIKCQKCEIKFNDRKDPDDTIGEDTLCWNCRFIWKCIKATLQALSADNPNMSKPLNRIVSIRLEDIEILKR